MIEITEDVVVTPPAADLPETLLFVHVRNTRLGPVDLDAYCRNVKGAQGVVLEGDGAYAWRCKSSNGRLSQIDMQDVCRKEKNNPKAFARSSDPRDKYSWLCFQRIEFGSVSLGNPPPPNPGKLLESCEDAENEIGGTALERSKVWSIGGSPEKYRFEAEWLAPSGTGFLEYLGRELGARFDWDKGELYLHVDMYSQNGELFDTQDRLRVDNYDYYVTSGARVFGTVERSRLSIPNRGTADIFMYVERAGFDLNACWLYDVR